MPRIAGDLLRKAFAENPLLPLLLKSCRDIESARQELRWLKEHVASDERLNVASSARKLRSLCEMRSRDIPLQYLLKSEFFGDLELVCRPGVLIPRQETASSVLYLLDMLRKNEKRLPSDFRLLDLCTGSGCIPLLFNSKYPLGNRLGTCSPTRNLSATGVDISLEAIQLARLNRGRVLEQITAASNAQATEDDPAQRTPSDINHRRNAIRNVTFVRADVLNRGRSHDGTSTLRLIDVLQKSPQQHWDCIISNPPYISPQAYQVDTARSVRKYEPRLALVPPRLDGSSVCEPGDEFYPEILRTADLVKAKILLLEVADMRQAHRVSRMASKSWTHVEIWRDQPQLPTDAAQPSLDPEIVRGQGHARSVFCCRNDGEEWCL